MAFPLFNGDICLVTFDDPSPFRTMRKVYSSTKSKNYSQELHYSELPGRPHNKHGRLLRRSQRGQRNKTGVQWDQLRPQCRHLGTELLAPHSFIPHICSSLQFSVRGFRYGGNAQQFPLVFLPSISFRNRLIAISRSTRRTLPLIQTL